QNDPLNGTTRRSDPNQTRSRRKCAARQIQSLARAIQEEIGRGIVTQCERAEVCTRSELRSGCVANREATQSVAGADSDVDAVCAAGDYRTSTAGWRKWIAVG